MANQKAAFFTSTDADRLKDAVENYGIFNFIRTSENALKEMVLEMGKNNEMDIDEKLQLNDWEGTLTKVYIGSDDHLYFQYTVTTVHPSYSHLTDIYNAKYIDIKKTETEGYSFKDYTDEWDFKIRITKMKLGDDIRTVFRQYLENKFHCYSKK